MLMHAAHNMLVQELSRLISLGKENVKREKVYYQMISERGKEQNLVSWWTERIQLSDTIKITFAMVIDR